MSGPLEVVMLVAVAACAAVALAQLVVVVQTITRVPRLKDLPVEERSRWPRVSVIMTARNEEEALEHAVGERLSETYPELELILVDDRSTDRTGAIADELARRDGRITVVHITELPAGWLGKRNALHQGVSRATGQWLVFSDADVAAGDGVYRRLIGYCEARGLDHVVVLPRMLLAGPVVDAMVSLFLRVVALNARIREIEDPGARLAVGAGAFNLVRRSAFERTPGFPWLKMEVADDVALGQMLKRHGARQSVLDGSGLLSLTFFRRVMDSLRSSERATWTAIGRFSAARLVAMSAVLLLVELSPLVGVVAGSPPVVAAGLVGLCAQLTMSVLVNRWNGRGLAHLVLLPLAQVLTAFALVRAAVLGRRRRGIVWRGTFYPEAQLRAGRRIEM